MIQIVKLTMAIVTKVQLKLMTELAQVCSPASPLHNICYTSTRNILKLIVMGNVLCDDSGDI